MKNDLLRRLETKAELKYAALYQAKMRMTLQIAQDAAMIAANEVLQLGPGRAEEFAMAFMETINDIGILMHDDQKDDKDYIYTRGVVDRKLENLRGQVPAVGGAIWPGINAV